MTEPTNIILTRVQKIVSGTIIGVFTTLMTGGVYASWQIVGQVSENKRIAEEVRVTVKSEAALRSANTDAIREMQRQSKIMWCEIQRTRGTPCPAEFDRLWNQQP